MDHHTTICVCPESLGGLTTPRAPAEIVGSRVVTSMGEDVTEAFYRGAEAALKSIEKYSIDAAILKANSPSCGCGRVYDGTFSKTLRDGDGIFAKMLKERGIRVFTENDEFDF